MEQKTKIIEELESLCRKADQTRTIHSMLRDRLHLVNRIFLLYVTIGSAVLAMLTFASLPSPWIVLIGVFSATVFIASLIPPTLNFDLKNLERTMAVQSWGEWLRDARNFCNVDIQNLDLASSTVRHKELLESYKKVMEKTPLIPNSKFNKFKRLHLQKIEISKALEKNPFKSICKIKKELSNR